MMELGTRLVPNLQDDPNLTPHLYTELLNELHFKSNNEFLCDIGNYLSSLFYLEWSLLSAPIS